MSEAFAFRYRPLSCPSCPSVHRKKSSLYTAPSLTKQQAVVQLYVGYLDSSYARTWLSALLDAVWICRVQGTQVATLPFTLQVEDFSLELVDHDFLDDEELALLGKLPSTAEGLRRLIPMLSFYLDSIVGCSCRTNERARYGCFPTVRLEPGDYPNSEGKHVSQKWDCDDFNSDTQMD